MTTWILPLGGLLCALLWLALLVATGFSLLVISLGLLAALYALNASASRPRNPTRQVRALQSAADHRDRMVSKP